MYVLPQSRVITKYIQSILTITLFLMNLRTLILTKPVFKKADTFEKTNYRPISVLPVLSKAFDRCLYDQIYEYIDCRPAGWLYSPARMRNISQKKSHNFRRLPLSSILYIDLINSDPCFFNLVKLGTISNVYTLEEVK